SGSHSGPYRADDAGRGRSKVRSTAAPCRLSTGEVQRPGAPGRLARAWLGKRTDRKSTRLNSSHVKISYAVFCLKKKKKDTIRKPYRNIHNEIHAKTDIKALERL